MKISFGQHSDKGRKEINQDFHGICVPREPQLSAKGIAIALADGISASDVSQIASQSAVTGFLEDYYCTSDAWSVKTSVERVLVATNSWLYSQTQQGQGRYDKDRGYVCTLSAMVFKSTTAHIFHVGDARIYRLHAHALEQLTNDHRIVVSAEQNYLSRAMGISDQLEIDYRTFPLDQGDVFLLATDGVYDHVDAATVIAAVNECGADLDAAARRIVQFAFDAGSTDNLTAQLVRIDELAQPEASEIYQQLAVLPFPPILEPRASFDGYTIIREVRGSSRSHIYLATDSETKALVIIKTPSIDMQHDPAYVERFLMEEWVARRINSAHVLKPCLQRHKRNFIYLVTEYIEGQTLAQWMRDHPKPDLESVRAIVEQIAKGVRAFHRMEMLHQDLRPENIMIDASGTVKIIDFGSTSVAGVMENETDGAPRHVLGAALYAAPEYFLGDAGTSRSDLFALGVITYQMLSGRLPYDVQIPKIKSAAQQRNLRYHSLLDFNAETPAWVDEAIRKAVHPLPQKRYDEVAEFVFELRHPNKEFRDRRRLPLIERNPVTFWKMVSFVLMLIILVRSAFDAMVS